MGKAARDRRTVERVDARRRAGRPYKMTKVSRSYVRWIKSLQNMKAYDSWGFPYYAFTQTPLIKNGRKF
jgi:hypothetical protein